jgi:hypothetical protein
VETERISKIRADNSEAKKYQNRNNKRKQETAVPDRKRDTLELSSFSFEEAARSDNYHNIAGNIKRAKDVSENLLLFDAGMLMSAYYAGKLDGYAVASMFLKCCEEHVERWKHNSNRKVFMREALMDTYEYFSRADVRKAVRTNREEGKELVEDSGLSWAGTTYYNARYFYQWEKMQQLLQMICNGLTEEYGLEPFDYEKIEKVNRFRYDGGLSYHEVFEWEQKRDNYPMEQYGLKEKGERPPRSFIYLYRNGFSESERYGVERLKEQIQAVPPDIGSDKGTWHYACVSGGMEYHNGRSYLLEKPEEADEEKMSSEESLKFLQIFRLYRIRGCAEMMYSI